MDLIAEYKLRMLATMQAAPAAPVATPPPPKSDTSPEAVESALTRWFGGGSTKNLTAAKTRPVVKKHENSIKVNQLWGM